MKNLLKQILVFALYYLIGSFIAWDFNVANWSWWGRLLCLVFATWGASRVLEDQYIHMKGMNDRALWLNLTWDI